MTDSQDNRNEAPYAVAAMRYRAAGWEGVLPLPPGAKFPPPPGFTGRRHAGMDPSVADIGTWIELGMYGGRQSAVDVPAGNIALRLPPDVVGLDVDAYDGKPGGETLAKLEAALGPLPPTWVSTSRHDGVSGIRLYRLPAGVREGGPGRRWLDEAGPGVDIIRHGHRYTVVAPSVVEGREYRWIAERHRPGVPELDAWPPEVSWLGELPPAWLGHVAPPAGAHATNGSAAPLGAGELDEVGAREWLEACRDDDGEPCGVIMAVLTEARRALAARGAAGSRHETALGASRAIAAYGGEGHNRAVSALSALGVAFEESTRGEGREGEWRSMLVGAVALARRAHPTPEGKCTCDAFIVPLDFSPPPEAGGQMAGTEMYPQGVENPVEKMLTEMLTVEQLRAMPNPVPLVSGVLDLDSLAWLIGKPGSYKSFVALDLAGHVSVGKPWLGRPVRQGGVVYLVAEGAGGFKLRVDAWERTHGQMGDIRFLPRPVQASSPEWNVLIEACRRLGPPVLFVIDTQARVTVGLDESGNTEMGMFIEQCERLRRATGGCVLVIHHIGRSGEDARGASAIDGAQGTELKIRRLSDLRVAIVQDKQKDMAQAEDIEVELIHVDGGVDPDTGRELGSLSVRGLDPFGTVRAVARDWIDNLKPNQAEIVGIVADHFAEMGGTKAEVVKTLQKRRGMRSAPEMATSSFYTAWDALTGRGVLVRVAGTQRYALDPDMRPGEESHGE